ncbi:MAG: glutamate-5-semialdehyde dehydrogenase [Mariniphaga sp.]|nr:glutamate-5-semialdehyde dehydrogenase [Mariniphaga sp.]
MNYREQFGKALIASRELNMLSDVKINAVLNKIADAAVKSTDFILRENQKDLARMENFDPKYDRLKLTGERLSCIAEDIRNVASLPSPVGRVLFESIRPNGLKITKITVPFGVIGIVFEARPNVTFDVFSLCLKSGNACILKGGTDAANSNQTIVSIIHKVLEANSINTHVLTLLPSGREATTELLNARGFVDLVIPRGSQGLIDYVRMNATIPVIETGAGICHTYFDEFGDLSKGAQIVNNAKTRRVSVCNALDCLIIHESRLPDLREIVKLLIKSRVEIYADKPSYSMLDGKYPDHLLQAADNESFGTEFLSYRMAIRTVTTFDEAIAHIAKYGSKHSEAIISENKKNCELFLQAVDAAAVYVNASTAFTDGAQFGLGAEIGISTQKLHARGPMGLEELTSYKWLVEGDGQIRP